MKSWYDDTPTPSSEDDAEKLQNNFSPFLSPFTVSVPAVYCQSFIVWRFDSIVTDVGTFNIHGGLRTKFINGMQRMQLPDLLEPKAKK